MKKLMIMASAMVCAAAVQAASVSWFNNNYTALAGGEASLDDGSTVYLIQTSAHSQADFISMIIAAGDSTSSIASTLSGWAADTVTTDAGSYGVFTKSGTTTSAFTQGASETAYVAIIDADNQNVFMSAAEIASYNGLSDTYNFNFNAVASASEGEAFTGYKSSQGAGWYQLESVPEPTSGLLLLIGMAGLALRRRRA